MIKSNRQTDPVRQRVPLKLIAPLQEGEMRARMLEAYGHAVVARMLPALQLTGDELLELAKAEAALTELFQSRPSFDDVSASCFDEVTESPPNDFIRDAQLDMAVTRSYVFGFAFVGLFHLFERQLATVLHILNYRIKGSVWARTPKHLKFCDLLDALTSGSVPVSDEFLRQVRRLQLITNVQKHSGNALAEIARDHSDLLPGWQEGMRLTPDMLSLTPALFEDFVATLADFWRTFPHE